MVKTKISWRNVFAFQHRTKFIRLFLLNDRHIFKCLSILSISCVVKNIASSLCTGFPIPVAGHTGTLHLF